MGKMVEMDDNTTFVILVAVIAIAVVIVMGLNSDFAKVSNGMHQETVEVSDKFGNKETKIIWRKP